MTFEERLAELGVDLSDLPKVHSYERRFAVAKNIVGIIDKELINRMNRACDLIEIIDRMETRIVNLTGELDWLRIKCCDICGLRPEYGEEVCESCDVNRGVPTNWRPRSEPTRTNEEASPAVPDLTKTKE